MDLVTSTLDKYLKHRFNGNVPPPVAKSTITTTTTTTTTASTTILETTTTTITSDSNAPISAIPREDSDTGSIRQDDMTNKTNDDNGQTIESTSHNITNDMISDTNEFLEVHSLSFQKLMPCCVAIHTNLTYIAAGFENSQIYLWTVIRDEDSDDASKNPQDSSQDSKPSTLDTNLELEKLDGPDNRPHKTNHLCLGAMSRLIAHSGSVYSMKFLQDNDLMLSCSEDATIRLWCLKSKCNLIIYRGHNYPIWSLAVSPHGDYFASASMDTTARLWSFDKMCPLRIFCGHERDVECVKFHPNAKYIATGSSDSTVRLWTISDGRMVRLMVGHNSPITSLSFLPNGKFLASSSGDGSIKVWNLATNSVSSESVVPAPCIVSFSFANEFASTCGRDNIINIWNIGCSSITQIGAYDFSGKFTKITQTHFHEDNKLFVVCFSEQKAEIDDTIPMIH